MVSVFLCGVAAGIMLTVIIFVVTALIVDWRKRKAQSKSKIIVEEV